MPVFRPPAPRLMALPVPPVPRGAGFRGRLSSLLLALSLASSPSPGQEASFFATAPPVLRFTSLTTEHGLSQNSVFAIIQDSQGFLWFGTENGLNRFDGHEFRLFPPAGSGGEALQGGLIQDLALDLDGQLWIAIEGGGIAHMDPRSGALESYRHDPQDPASLPSDLVRILALDQRGRLWVGTRSAGLQRLRADGRGFDHFSPDLDDPCALRSNNVAALLVDRHDTLWVGTDLGLQRYAADRNCFETEALGPPDQDALPVTTLYEDRQGALWVATRQGQIYHLEASAPGETPTFRSVTVAPRKGSPLSGTWVSAFAEDDDGHLWIATIGQGLFRLDRGSGELVWVRGDPTLRGSLRNNSVRCLFMDRDGSLWAGLEQGGVSQLPATRSRLAHYRDLDLQGDTASMLGVFSIFPGDDDEVWVGTMDRGLFGFRPGRPGATRLLGATGSSGLPQAGRIYSLTAGRPGEVLIATSEGLLLSLDPRTRQIQEVAQLTLGSRALSIRSLAALPSGEIWAATWGGGLKVFEAQRGPPTELRHDPGDPHSLSEDIVISLHQDARDSLWVGTWSRGLNRLDLATGAVERFVLEDGPQAGRERIASILRQTHGAVWVSTEQGVFRSIDGRAPFQREDAFGQGIVYSLLEDRDGGIWASGTSGLQRLDPVNGGIRRLRYQDGLQDGEFNLGAAAKSSSGALIFGGPGGVNVLRPEALPPPSSPPPVVLTSLRTGSRSLPIPEPGKRSPAPVVLGPGERSLSLTAAVLEFRHPLRNRFAYRLEARPRDRPETGEVSLEVPIEDPLEDLSGWVEAGTNHAFSFPNLAAGDYRLRVAGADGDGVWNRPGVSVPVVVKPRFWERLEVRIASLALAAGLLVFAVAMPYQRRARLAFQGHAEALEGKQRLLEAREQERLHLAQELHDGPLQTVHALQLQLSRQGPGESTAGEELPGGLKVLVQELRDYCARLRSPLLQPYGLAPAMLELAERFRRDHPQVALTLNLEPDGQRLSEASRLALYRIYQEAVGNAVRHGGAGTIAVALLLRSREVELEIVDDGCGFEPPERWIHMARQGRLGVLGMIERAESVGGTATIHSSPGGGARVRVIVPAGSRRERREA